MFSLNSISLEQIEVNERDTLLPCCLIYSILVEKKTIVQYRKANNLCRSAGMACRVTM